MKLCRFAAGKSKGELSEPRLRAGPGLKLPFPVRDRKRKCCGLRPGFLPGPPPFFTSCSAPPATEGQSCRHRRLTDWHSHSHGPPLVVTGS